MVSGSKRIRKAREMVNADLTYSVDDAMKMLEEYGQTYKTKFDESVDVIIKLNIDPKQADQMVRGAVTMPNGLGKNIKVAVFSRPELLKEAKDAGADIYDNDKLAENIKNGKIEFDVLIASADMMPQLSKFGKILGPQGLMPNPKLGTVTDDIKTAVLNAKSGQVEYKAEKSGIIHAAVGKISFNTKLLMENILAFYNAVLLAKPSGAKGNYVKGFWLSTSMGPSFRLDLEKIIR